jgi:hypothetical protein
VCGAARGVYSKNRMPSERSQTQTTYVILFMGTAQNSQNHKDREEKNSLRKLLVFLKLH